MELIPYEKFGKLRMRQLAPGKEVHESDGWADGRFLDKRGHPRLYERFSPRGLAGEAGGLEVDFRDLPEQGVLAIFGAIGLPLRPAMTLQEVLSVLGQPEHTHIFVADRKSYDFTIGSQHPYHVSTTVHDTDGLIYVAVVRKDVLSKCDA